LQQKEQVAEARRVRQIVRGSHEPTSELLSVAPLFRAARAFKHCLVSIARALVFKVTRATLTGLYQARSRVAW
jgi:hypothetical protein